MNTLRPEVVASIVALIVVIALLRARKKPKEKYFTCARCSANSVHTNRTIEAWRNGKTKFFCNACHAKWLQSQPTSATSGRSSGSGCLGVLVLLALVPLGLLFL
jgi:transposase-like protein